MSKSENADQPAVMSLVGGATLRTPGHTIPQAPDDVVAEMKAAKPKPPASPRTVKAAMGRRRRRPSAAFPTFAASGPTPSWRTMSAPKPRPPRRTGRETGKYRGIPDGGQHFLLSPKANFLPVAKVVSMKEEDAYRWFMRARFPETKGVAYCPACGTLDATPIRRRRFVCTAKECRKEFSVTSGTILASRKLSFKTLLLALALSVHSVKGKAACELKRELAVDYKTAFVLLHKLREALADAREGMKLEGVVEMDAMYLGGHVKPKNVKAERVDRRIAENRSGKRMAVMALRERKEGGRTLAAAVPGEQAAVAWHLVRNHVGRHAELRADQNPAYDELVGLHPLVRNDHSVAHVQEPGVR